MLFYVMKEISNYLIHFIENNLKKNQWKEKEGSHNHQFINTFLNQLINSEQEYNKNYNMINRQILSLTKIDFPKSQDYSSITENIRVSIDKKEKIGIHYKFSINEQEIELYIIYPFEKNEKISDIKKEKMNTFFDSCLKKVYMWLFIAYPYKNKSCSEKLVIYLYLSNLSKLINKNKIVILNQEIVNSGFTYTCKTDNNIVIYREEEWFKVFIHETFHSFGFDFSGSSSLTEIAKNKILELFEIQSDVLLYETYTELNAEILNNLFFVYFTMKKKNYLENNTFIRNFEKYMNYERIFSCFQCVKVLHYNNIKYQDLLTKQPNEYREQTNVFVYFILKSILITYYKEYLDWIMINNNGSLNYIKTESQLSSFIDLIKKKYMDSDYLQKIEKMEKWFLQNKNKHSLEYTTLRMTAIEF